MRDLDRSEGAFGSELPISVVMLTLNEAAHLPEALRELRPWVRDIYIVDSLSEDATVDIALKNGANVVQRPFTNFGNQWNWALDSLPIQTPWVMKMDPDERVTPALRDELARLLEEDPKEAGFEMRRRLWFMGQADATGPVGDTAVAARLVPVL